VSTESGGVSAPGALGPPGPLDPELRAKLEVAPVAGLSAQLRKRGLNNMTIDGVRPVHPEAKLVGTAKTLRFVPRSSTPRLPRKTKTHGSPDASRRATPSRGFSR
jgi:hypothetical protein